MTLDYKLRNCTKCYLGRYLEDQVNRLIVRCPKCLEERPRYVQLGKNNREGEYSY